MRWLLLVLMLAPWAGFARLQRRLGNPKAGPDGGGLTIGRPEFSLAHDRLVALRGA